MIDSGRGMAAAGAADLSVVMPCLNEEDSVRWCVERAWRGIAQTGLRGEVVVCDNGSVDRSVEVATEAGARVVDEARRGYGRAYLTGIESSVGRIIVIGDSDCSYDFFELHALVRPLLEGYDYVLGSRFSGTILPGAMPYLNRYLGNPLLTGLLNGLFGLHTSDAHSGMRAFTRSAYERMELRCEGMEFASEIVIAAARSRLRVAEVPITYHPRLGHSKLRRWRDGVRHVRFMVAEAVWPETRGTEAAPAGGVESERGRSESRRGAPAGQSGGSDRSSSNGSDRSSSNGSRHPSSATVARPAVAAGSGHSKAGSRRSKAGSGESKAGDGPEDSEPEPSAKAVEP